MTRRTPAHASRVTIALTAAVLTAGLAACGEATQDGSAPTLDSSVSTTAGPDSGLGSDAPTSTSAATTPAPSSSSAAKTGSATASATTSPRTSKAPKPTRSTAPSTRPAPKASAKAPRPTVAQAPAPRRSAPRGAPTRVVVRAASGSTIISQSLRPLYLNKGALNPPGGVAGWYAENPWPKPGFPGASILAGHVTHAGAPDVFYRLSSARVGDRITVSYSSGDQVAFRVTKSGPKDKRAAQYDGSIWDLHNPKPLLRLITCDLDTPTRSDGHRTGNWVVWASLA